ncbi:MAG: hypothetical protein HUK26_00285 [Duodenibacillus sp.]|nr:hypothetical protein [Duodenibacillus sp.]
MGGNNLLSYLVAAVMACGMVAAGILLLPVLGGILLLFLVLLLSIVLYGAYYRWRYGDPFKQMREQMQRAYSGFAGSEDAQPREESRAAPDKLRVGVRRTTTVDEVEVVSEVRKRPAGGDGQ